jgi:beta-lactamase regulating signal transducer with metallopeptidase domain
MIGFLLHSLVTANGWFAGLSQVATGSLVAAVWQGILLALAVALGLRLVPRAPAAVRFAIWFGVFLVVAVLPMSALLAGSAGSTQNGAQSAWLTLDSRWSLAIAAVWVAASMVRAATLLLAGLRVRALWRRATPVEIAGAVNIPGARRAQLCTSDEVDRPTVIGFFSPKILIPGWLIEKLTAAELEQIVVHESGHLGRADDWMNLLQKLALVIFPLNPALAWVERRLCFERELAVDERVLRAFAGKAGAAKAYASCLATLAEHRLERRGLKPRLALVLGALGRESELGRRVKRILERGEGMRPLHARLVLGGAMLGLLGSAVGLEHCPQVVGFSSSGGQDAVVSSQPQVRRFGRYGYQAVIFHPQAATMPQVSQRAGGIQVVRSSSNEGVGGSLPHVVLVNAPLPRASRGSSPRATWGSSPRAFAMEAQEPQRIASSEAGVREAEWVLPASGRMQLVVVTSWESGDGPRPAMTASVWNARLLPQSESDQPEAAGDRQQPWQGVHPYAAVPVRDGWLVFQL